MTSMTRGKDYIGVGVGAVVLSDSGEILLLRRKKAPEVGHWTIPGGTVEFGEEIEDAILRELFEELGVMCEIVRLLGVTNHIVRAEGSHWVSPCFLVRIVDGIPENKESGAHSEMAWFPLDALPLSITLTTRKAVDRYRATTRQ